MLEAPTSNSSVKASFVPKHAGTPDTFEQEEVEFTFQKVKTTITNGGTSCQDSWADNGDGTGGSASSGGSASKPKNKFGTLAFNYQVHTPFDNTTGKPSGKRPWAPMQRKMLLVMPAHSVLVPQLKQMSVSKATISSLVVSWGLCHRERLKLADVQVTNFVPHGGHSGRIGDYVAFDLVAADTALPGTGVD